MFWGSPSSSWYYTHSPAVQIEQIPNITRKFNNITSSPRWCSTTTSLPTQEPNPAAPFSTLKMRGKYFSNSLTWGSWEKLLCVIHCDLNFFWNAPVKNDFSLWFSMKGSTKSPSQNSPAGVGRGGRTKNSQSLGISKKSWHFQDWFDQLPRPPPNPGPQADLTIEAHYMINATRNILRIKVRKSTYFWMEIHMSGNGN